MLEMAIGAGQYRFVFGCRAALSARKTNEEVSVTSPTEQFKSSAVVFDQHNQGVMLQPRKERKKQTPQ